MRSSSSAYRSSSAPIAWPSTACSVSPTSMPAIAAGDNGTTCATRSVPLRSYAAVSNTSPRRPVTGCERPFARTPECDAFNSPTSRFISQFTLAGAGAPAISDAYFTRIAFQSTPFMRGSWKLSRSHVHAWSNAVILSLAKLDVHFRVQRDRLGLAALFQRHREQLAVVEVIHLLAVGTELRVGLVAAGRRQLARDRRFVGKRIQRPCVEVGATGDARGDHQRLAVGTEHDRLRVEARWQQREALADAVGIDLHGFRFLRRLALRIVPGGRIVLVAGFVFVRRLGRGLAEQVAEQVAELVFAELRRLRHQVHAGNLALLGA